MGEIDWSKAPLGDVRYSKVPAAWLEKKNGKIWYTSSISGDHYEGADQIEAQHHWDNATPLPGSEVVNNDVDNTVTQRGERYGLFADGAVIMQDLKTVMRATPGWERLTPSQHEALEMIQHKIGRVLNGDPTYDDNWRDIAGYATLILNELNGVKR